MGDYYDILEVPHDASDEDIKRSYRKLALKYHPDKAGAAGEAKFKEINAAYEVLSNPEKKKIYDRYGETGLNAMDGPMQSVVPLGAMNAVIPVVVLFLFLITAMQLIFLAFIAAYNNHKLQSWNYVKVFSPLFVSDVLVGVPALILFILLPCVLGGRFLFAMLSLLLVMLCSVLLTILIPIAKDRNDQRVREGRTDFLKWRVWLIPGYILSVFFVLFVCLAAFPSKEKKEAMKAYRLKRLANYQPISFIFKLLAALCVPVFFALIACRSDNTITINYFIVIGVPMYVATFFIILDYVITRILQCVLTVEDDDDDNNNNNENENNENNNNNNERPNRDENNQYSTDEGEAPPRGNNNNNENNNNNNNKKKKKGTTVCAVYNCCGLLFKIFGFIVLIGMLVAAGTMITVRLNDLYQFYYTYDDSLDLWRCLIPLYILLGLVTLLLLVLFFTVLCCGVVPDDMEGEQPPQPQQQEEDDNNDNNEYPQEENNNNNNADNDHTPNGYTTPPEPKKEEKPTSNVSDID